MLTKKQKKLLSLLVAGSLLSMPVRAEKVPAIKLEDVSINALVKTVSKVTGKNFVVDPSVRGQITFITGSGISEEELYDTFISILQVHNLAAVEVGNLIKILPIQKSTQTVAPIVDITDEPARNTAPSQAGANLDFGAYDQATRPPPPSQPNATNVNVPQDTIPRIPSDLALDQTVTQVITLQYIPALTANATLVPLVGQGDTRIQVNQSSNSLIVTGRAQNVARVIQLANNIDKPNNNDFELINLRYAVATQVAQTLQQILGSGAGGDPALPNLGKISADERTNSVIISGDKSTRERLRSALMRLDTPRKETGGTRIIRIRYASAEEMASTLQGISQGVQQQTAGVAEGSAAALAGSTNLVNIAADRGTNSLVVTAPDYLFQNIIQVVKQLDIPKREKGIKQVVKLKYASAEEMATTLQGVVQTVQQNNTRTEEGAAAAKADGTNAVSIVPDRNTNALVVIAPSYIFNDIMRMVRQLDVPQKKRGGTVVIPLKYAKAEELVEVLKGVSPSLQKQTQGATEGAAAAAAAGSDEVSVLADKTTNSIVITAPDFMQANLRRVIAQLDQRRAQVMIEAIIAEVSTDLANKLGVSLASVPQSGNGGLVGASNLGGGLSQAFSLASGGASAAASLGSGLLFGLGRVIGNTQFGLIANALKGDAATNILATPTLVTLDNEEASIVVGQEVPFLTGSYSGTGSGATPTNPFNTIERRDVGLNLKVTPQINRGRTIKLKIDQEASSLASSSASASDVITNKRKISTNVMVEDGQILVLGGLIEDTFRDAKERVPGLSNIPIVGRLFQSTNTAKTKQNLMVFIHPVILPDGEAADAYTREKYYTMQQQQGNSQVLQRGTRDQRATPLRNVDQSLYTVDELHQPFDPFRSFGTCTQVFCPEGL